MAYFAMVLLSFGALDRGMSNPLGEARTVVRAVIGLGLV